MNFRVRLGEREWQYSDEGILHFRARVKAAVTAALSPKVGENHTLVS